MTAGESQIELARYRLKQAEESIDEAAFLLQGKKSPRAVINRAYYAMFYAVLALLIFEPYASSKHSGVLGYFNRRFVKPGIFPEELGRIFFLFFFSNPPPNSAFPNGLFALCSVL